MKLPFAVLSASICVTAVYAQPALPPQVQADILLSRIDAAVAAGNAQEALSGISDYRKLGVKIAPALLFLEGRLAAIAKDYVRSQRVILQYLSLPEARGDKSYQDALALYADTQRINRDVRESTERELVRNMNPECIALRELARETVEKKVARSEFQECPFAPNMVIVPAGEFAMGTDNPSVLWRIQHGQTWPQRNVKLKAFAIGKYEVTFGEWNACVASGGCNQYIPQGVNRPKNLKDASRLPVSRVSWDDSQAYVTWLSKQTGHSYRLLSEAEWEYAARGGAVTPFNTGGSLNKSQANVKGDALVEVGSYPANGFGLHDVHGNVIEWVQDCWNPSFLGAPLDNSAWNEAVLENDAVQQASCDMRVSRGTAYFLESEHHTLTRRGPQKLNERHPNWGFRVARDLD